MVLGDAPFILHVRRFVLYNEAAWYYHSYWVKTVNRVARACHIMHIILTDRRVLLSSWNIPNSTSQFQHSCTRGASYEELVPSSDNNLLMDCDPYVVVFGKAFLTPCKHRLPSAAPLKTMLSFTHRPQVVDLN